MQSNTVSGNKVFIPLKPNKRLRFRKMLAAFVPAFVLISASFSVEIYTTGGHVLKYFNIVVAFLILVVNFIGYKYPDRDKLLGADMTLVLSGLLIIAQGASSFDPLKGFQPAHLLFLAGAFSIFKGVMLPEAKVKRGFMISEDHIEFRKKVFSKVVSIKRNDIVNISGENDVITFKMIKNQETRINLSEYENSGHIYSELLELLNLPKSVNQPD